MKLFVSYNGCITGFGMCQSEIEGKPKINMELINEIQKDIRIKQKDNTIVILNWKELDASEVKEE